MTLDTWKKRSQIFHAEYIYSCRQASISPSKYIHETLVVSEKYLKTLDEDCERGLRLPFLGDLKMLYSPSKISQKILEVFQKGLVAILFMVRWSLL